MRRRARLAALLLAVGGATAWIGLRDENADLTVALDGGAGRRVTPAPRRTALAWASLGATSGIDAPRAPRSLCWSGDDLYVADAATQRVLRFDARGVLVTRPPVGDLTTRRFVELAQVSCAPSADRIAVVDQGAREIAFFDTKGGALTATTAAPMLPQGLPLAAVVALSDQESWYASWLGSASEIGPYLSAQAWDSTALVTVHTSSDSARVRLGAPAAYLSTVARRVLGRTSLAAAGDSLWVLTHGDARLSLFLSAHGTPVASLLLPVHFRGAEPSEHIRVMRDTTGGFRLNTFRYQPNVGGFARTGGAEFLVIRYSDWGWRLIGTGIGSLMPDAHSAIDVLGADGRLRGSYGVPGFAQQVSASRGGTMSVLTRQRSGRMEILSAPIPALATCVADGESSACR